VTVPSAIKEQAARDAQALLATVWSGRGRSVPVDPIRIAQELGIQVLEAPLAPDVSAALIKRPGEDPQIVVNRDDSRNRQRFSCAHELGHFYLRRDDQEQYDYVDFRDSFSASGLGDAEVYANEFAACLLMPADEMRALHGQGCDEVQMAVHFNVSRDALHFRAKNLSLA
jgi:Zn-dependent peptidase ImmA (M78 family)